MEVLSCLKVLIAIMKSILHNSAASGRSKTKARSKTATCIFLRMRTGIEPRDVKRSKFVQAKAI